MLLVPIVALPSQTLTTTINGQITQLNIYQKFFGLFMDVYVNNSLIVGGVLCQNMNRIVRSTYLGYNGDFFFFDSQGERDPSYDGLGSRWNLYCGTTDKLVIAGVG